MGNPEPLLFIHDQQAQIFKLNIFREKPMSADNNIHLAFFQVFNGLFLLRRSPESAHQINTHRKILHPLDKGIVMLLGQDRGRHQVHHLLALLHRLKSRPDGDLCFSVSHVSADQPVHDLGAFHVFFGGFYSSQLILRLLKGEHFLKFPLPYRVRAVLITGLGLPCGV